MIGSVARIGELEIGYDLRGTGEPLLLVAGFAMTRAMWEDDFCDRLAAAGHTVVRMDNRDTGQSTRLTHLGTPNMKRALVRSILGLSVEHAYTLEAMAEDAVGLMRHLGHARFHVVGASMGGMIAQTMALTHGDRVSSLTSIMSTPGGRRYSVASPKALLALLQPAPMDPEAQVEHITKLLRTIGGALPFEEARARGIAEAQVASRPLAAGAVRQFSAILDSSGRRRALLTQITTPTLIIHGSKDPLLPLRGAKAMAKLVRGAELLVIDGMGHELHSTAHERVIGAIARHVARR